MKRSTAFLLALAIVLLLAAINADFFFRQPYYEFWDLAANSLSIRRAKHFAEIYGPYSRFHFHHPGPGYFYVEAMGEWLFHDLLHVVPAPYNGQLLMHLCLTAGLFVAGVRVFTRWLPVEKRWTFVCLALGLATLHFGATNGLPSFVNPFGGPTAFLSNWSAHFLVLPFFSLLAAGASIACGDGQELPLLVLSGGFLVHAHVAEPLFVVPTACLAYAGLLWNVPRPGTDPSAPTGSRRQRGVWRGLFAPWRATPRAHVWAVVLLAVFLLPLIIDVCRGRESNLAEVLRHMRSHHEAPKRWSRALVYFVQFMVYSPYWPDKVEFGGYRVQGLVQFLEKHAFVLAGWLLAAGLVLLAPVDYLRAKLRARRARESTGTPDAQESIAAAALTESAHRFLASAAGFAALAVGLSLFWGTRQEGRMYYYNAWYNFGILYFILLIAAGVACARPWKLPMRWRAALDALPPERRQRSVRAVSFALLAVTVGLSVPTLRLRDRYVGDGNRALHEGVRQAIAATNAVFPHSYKVFSLPLPFWSQAAAVALQMERAGEPFVIPEDWEVVYGPEHGWQAQQRRDPQAKACPWYFDLVKYPRPGMEPGAPEFDLHPGVCLRYRPATLRLAAIGETAIISFTPGGNSADYTLIGWSSQETMGRWTDQAWAALCFRPQRVAAEYVEVTMDVLPFVKPLARGEVYSQHVSVCFNGEPLGVEHTFLGRELFAFHIPAALWNAAASGEQPKATLEFYIPTAVTPASLDATAVTPPPLDPDGGNQDMRHVGFHFLNMWFVAK